MGGQALGSTLGSSGGVPQLNSTSCSNAGISWRLADLWRAHENTMMLLRRSEWWVAVFCAGYVPVFTWMAYRGQNYEFVLYGLIVVLIGLWVVLKQRSAGLPLRDLWGLAIWGILHMAGGNLMIGGTKLYDTTLIPLVGAPYGVLGYDHVVHFFGCGVATCVCFDLLRAYLADTGLFAERGDDTEGLHGGTGDVRKGKPLNATLCGLVVLMGLGVGTLNELLEFAVVIIVPETGVGGYENTLLDMVFNLLGAIAAILYLRGKVDVL